MCSHKQLSLKDTKSIDTRCELNTFVCKQGETETSGERTRD